MIRITLTLGLFLLNSFSFAEKANRIEDLFVWKISEELKLSVKEEKDLTILIHDLNKRKLVATDYVQSVIVQMAQENNFSKKKSGSKKLLQEYQRALQKYNDIALDEVRLIQKIFTADKATKYFVIKSELSQKIRNLLSTPERAQDRSTGPVRPEVSKKLPEPKIIEE